MRTTQEITYGGKSYCINEEALKGISAEWRCILSKGYADRSWNGWFGEPDDVDAICNADGRLEEYTAEDLKAFPDDKPAIVKGPCFFASTCDSDEGEVFADFWDAASYILTDDAQNGGTWTADEMIAALKKPHNPRTCFAMIEALTFTGALEEVEEC